MGNPKCTDSARAWLRTFEGFYRLESVPRAEARAHSRTSAARQAPPTSLDVTVDADNCAIRVSPVAARSSGWVALPNNSALGATKSGGTLSAGNPRPVVITETAERRDDGALLLGRSVRAPWFQLGSVSLGYSAISQTNATMVLDGERLQVSLEARVANGQVAKADASYLRVTDEEGEGGEK